MDHVTSIRDTGFIACKTCLIAILPSHINKHFQKSPHRLDQETRNNLFHEVKQWPNLVLSLDQIVSQIERLLKNPKSFSELTIHRDELDCFEHTYIVRNRRSIQNHFREYHD